MTLFTDQMRREVALRQFPPRRIVSLVPSQTELLAELGLAAEVVGITKFCIHPADWFQTKPRIGGTKTLHLGKLAALQPDLILGNKEENDREQIEQLAAHFPVWMSDIVTLDDAFDMICALGHLCNRPEQAQCILQDIKTQRESLPPVAKPRRAAYLIWRKPHMAAGSGTFVHHMLQAAGFDNVFAHLQRYPEIDAEQLERARPELILLSSEPYPFAEKHIAEYRDICPHAQVLLVDGEAFSWYGSRMRQSFGYFRELRLQLGF